MKLISTPLQTMLSGQPMTCATCWRLQRLDGTVYTFTDHDRDLTIGGELYAADSGFQRSAVEGDASLAAANLQMIGFISALNKQDLENGVMGDYDCRVCLANWQSPDESGIIKLRRGWLGEVTIDDSGEFQAELRGLAQTFGNPVGELFTPECRAQLFDNRCRVDQATFTFPAVCGTDSTRSVFYHTTLSNPDGYFDGGVVVMTSGANNGVRREILTWSGGALALFLPMPHAITTGDHFNAFPGCDHKLATCINKFNNLLNFRREPFVPGADALLDAPAPGGTSAT